PTDPTVSSGDSTCWHNGHLLSIGYFPRHLHALGRRRQFYGAPARRIIANGASEVIVRVACRHARPAWPTPDGSPRVRHPLHALLWSRPPMPGPGRKPAPSTRLSAHQRPAGFLEVRHDVAPAPLALASLGHRPLMHLATVHLPAVEDHDVFALGDKLHVG